MHYSQQVSLFGAGLDLRAAFAVKERIMQVQYADNTIINYRSNWRSFERWCRAAGRTHMPATPVTCIDHASWCIAEGDQSARRMDRCPRRLARATVHGLHSKPPHVYYRSVG